MVWYLDKVSWWSALTNEWSFNSNIKNSLMYSTATHSGATILEYLIFRTKYNILVYITRYVYSQIQFQMRAITRMLNKRNTLMTYQWDSGIIIAYLAKLSFYLTLLAGKYCDILNTYPRHWFYLFSEVLPSYIKKSMVIWYCMVLIFSW